VEVYTGSLGRTCHAGQPNWSTIRLMGNPGGRPSDDDALRRASEQAAIDALFRIWPELRDDLAGRYLRGELALDRDGRPIPDPDSGESGPETAPGPDSLASASGLGPG
jgi:hypothetical protein